LTNPSFTDREHLYGALLRSMVVRTAPLWCGSVREISARPRMLDIDFSIKLHTVAVSHLRTVPALKVRVANRPPEGTRRQQHGRVRDEACDKRPAPVGFATATKGSSAFRGNVRYRRQGGLRAVRPARPAAVLAGAAGCIAPRPWLLFVHPGAEQDLKNFWQTRPAEGIGLPVNGMALQVVIPTAWTTGLQDHG
jgi:hypothetical protein